MLQEYRSNLAADNPREDENVDADGPGAQKRPGRRLDRGPGCIDIVDEKHPFDKRPNTWTIRYGDEPWKHFLDIAYWNVELGEETS